MKRLALLLFFCVVCVAGFGAAVPLLPAGVALQDNSGQPLASGFIYTYAGGTGTPKTTWADAGQTIVNTNPVTLDPYGRAQVFCSGVYKFVVKDSTNVTIMTMDNVVMADPTSITSGTFAVLSATSATLGSATVANLTSPNATLSNPTTTNGNFNTPTITQMIASGGSWASGTLSIPIITDPVISNGTWSAGVFLSPVMASATITLGAALNCNNAFDLVNMPFPGLDRTAGACKGYVDDAIATAVASLSSSTGSGLTSTPPVSTSIGGTLHSLSTTGSWVAANSFAIVNTLPRTAYFYVDVKGSAELWCASATNAPYGEFELVDDASVVYDDCFVGAKNFAATTANPVLITQVHLSGVVSVPAGVTRTMSFSSRNASVNNISFPARITLDETNNRWYSWFQVK